MALVRYSITNQAVSSSEGSASTITAFALPLTVRLGFSCTCATSWSSGRSSAMPDFAQDATTVEARTDSSDRAWRSLETVRPPRENARSASAAVAKNGSETIERVSQAHTWRCKDIERHRCKRRRQESSPVLDGIIHSLQARHDQVCVEFVAHSNVAHLDCKEARRCDRPCRLGGK